MNSHIQNWSRKTLGVLRDLLSQSRVYYAFVSLSALPSFAWLAYALHHSRKDDAGRGGAVTIILSFFILFLRRSYGERVFKAVLKVKPEIQTKLETLVKRAPDAMNIARGGGVEPVSITFTNEEASWLLLGLLGWLNTEADSQTKQNWALFAASVFGTIMWGFGDVFYLWFGGKP